MRCITFLCNIFQSPEFEIICFERVKASEEGFETIPNDLFLVMKFGNVYCSSFAGVLFISIYVFCFLKY